MEAWYLDIHHGSSQATKKIQEWYLWKVTNASFHISHNHPLIL
jgi:hypothetical protein